MPRFLPLITGLGLAAAVTFHFKGKVSETSFDMHQRLNSVKKTLDNAVTLERNKTYGSPKYSSSQFVPSGSRNKKKKTRKRNLRFISQKLME
ncbi:hypothetical protein BY458DRAFT_437332 [Sporodiniella umbellata]|nr:hypothetical protein BY458DRAFT_437332 [Sporodiniella umbellata]